MAKTIPEHMEEIEKIYPLERDFEKDARFTWVERWVAMKEIFEGMIPMQKEVNDEPK